MASYLHTVGTCKNKYATIPERLWSIAEKYPDKISMIVYDADFKRHEITRKDMYNGAVKFAKVLIKLGIRKGDTVALCAPNCIEWMSYDVGIMMAGAYSMRLMFGLSDMKSILKGCHAVVFGFKSIWESFSSIAKITDGGMVSSEACPDLKFAINVSNKYTPDNALSAVKLMADISDDDKTEFPYIDPEDIAAINQTSGTTGVPKRICHSHFDYLNIPDSEIIDDNKIDILFNNRPMGYIGGYPIAVLTKGSTHLSGDVEMLTDPKNFDFVINMWQKEKCSIVSLAPQDLKRVGDQGFRIPMIVSGGDMITREAIEESFKFTDCFAVAYGSTEALFISIKLFTPDNISGHRQGTLGMPIGGTEIKIVDSDKKVVDIGKPGQLYFRAQWNTKRYFDGSSCLDNGWYPTSDICYLTEDGEIIMVGRSTDFIKKCTVKLSIKLIEDYVGRHPSTEAVVVVPIPDEEVGERVCVCVTIRPNHEFNEDELKKFCKETMPAPDNFDCVSMHPDYFLHFPVFPLLASGKCDKKKIANIALERVKSP
ncbi:acyl-CoA synthetase family member 2, mitochondrial-like isoform X2 [Argonauta hians]